MLLFPLLPLEERVQFLKSHFFLTQCKTMNDYYIHVSKKCFFVAARNVILEVVLVCMTLTICMLVSNGVLYVHRSLLLFGVAKLCVLLQSLNVIPCSAFSLTYLRKPF